ncbi:MAG: serine/threonine-protein kinase, partial [Pseudomonadota bacterium]
MSLSSGDVVDHRYVIEREIGRGGMGVVYLAHDQDGKPIAIKTLTFPPQVDVSARSPNYQRFIRELDVLSRVQHTNIVRFIAGGRQPTDRTGTLLWLAQEYIPGPTLYQQIAAAPGRIPVAKVVRWMCQLFDALGVLHASDFQHRDLKPGNIIFLTEDDVPKLIDFGVASSKQWRRLTKQMTAMGTFDYMSPEQLDPSVDEDPVPEGKTDRGLSRTVIDARTDIYTLGYIAWETLVGRRPFEATPGASLSEQLMQRRAFVVPPVHEVRPDVPEELSELIGKLLEPDREKRIQTAVNAALQFHRVARLLVERNRPRIIRNITDATPLLASTGVSIDAVPDDDDEAPPPLTKL